MTYYDLIQMIKDITDEKTTGVLTVVLHEGGIRTVKIEKELKK